MRLALACLLAALFTCAFSCSQDTQTKTEPSQPTTRFTHPIVEARGVWLSSHDLLGTEKSLLKKLDDAKRANFNTILIDTWFRGYVTYPNSEFAPQFPAFSGRDMLKFIIDEVHKRGMRAEAWLEHGFYAYFTTDAKKDKSMGAILDKNPELLSINFRGDRFIHRSFGDYYSMCPANPKSHEILARIVGEILTRYHDIDGINLDHIRFADADYCYCNHCRKNFEADEGTPLEEFSPDSKEARKWLDWKREQSSRAVSFIAGLARDVRPNLPITSYVVGPDEMDSKAQGWDLWIQRKLLDAVAVSMYDADIRPAAEKSLALLRGDKSKLICAISCEVPTAAYVNNVATARKYSTIGQFTGYLGAVADDIDALSAGPYEKRAAYPQIQHREAAP